MLPCDGEQPAVDNPLLSLVPPTDALGPCPSAPLDCVNEPDYIPLRPDQRTGYEEFWATHCAFLGRLGYILRPRYQPGWKPSWPTNKEPKKYCEDAYALDLGFICDATRRQDGAHVVLKHLSSPMHKAEILIGETYSDPALQSFPGNHCARILEVIDVPGTEYTQSIIVMPQLRELQNPRFDTIGEIVDCVQQIFEGLVFMHSNFIAHRDIGFTNVMMDASTMYPDSWHHLLVNRSVDIRKKARHYTRTEMPPRYLLIDFGFSQLSPSMPPREHVLIGHDKTVPEHQNPPPEGVDPFAVDVYCLGNMIRRIFLEGFAPEFPPIRGLTFLVPLIRSMVATDPEARPKMEDAVKQLDVICAQLSKSKLRSRAVYKNEWPLLNLPSIAGHWLRRFRYNISHTPAIPVWHSPAGIKP